MKIVIKEMEVKAKGLKIMNVNKNRFFFRENKKVFNCENLKMFFVISSGTPVRDDGNFENPVGGKFLRII